MTQAQSDMDLFNAISQTSEGSRFAEQEAELTRDPRTGRIITDGLRDDALIVSFTTDKVFSKVETYKNGGDPTYVDMDFITITVPGDRDNTVHTPVTDYYQWRFPKEYAAFKQGKDGIINGTPLADWTEVSPSQVKELSFHGITTVEQIANLSDSVSGALRAFHKMKAKAKVFLEHRNKVAATTEVQTLLAEQAQQHATEMAEMKAKLDALMALVEGNAKAVKAK